MHDDTQETMINAFITEAQALLDNGKAESAAVLLGRACKLNPKHSGVLRLQGVIHARTGRYQEALPLLTEAYSAAPNDWLVVDALTDVASAVGERVQARLLLSRFVDAAPDNAAAREKLGNSFDHYTDFYHAYEASGVDIRTLVPSVAEGERPYFSVVTPSYNQAMFLEDTIRATMWQNFSSYEHIVFDGGSTDGSVDILKKYPHLKWVSEPDRGQTHALNKGFAKARGEVIAWINSDDFHAPETFRAVADWFAKHPHERVVMGDCMWVFEQTGRHFMHGNREKSFEDIIRYWSDFFHPSQQAVFFKRELLEEVGFLDESLDFTMDWDFFLRLTLRQPIRYIPKLLGVYRFHGESKSGYGDDWSDFYPDQQRVYPRFKEFSRQLPQQTLVSAVLPCTKRLMSVPGYVEAVHTIIRHLGEDIMRDMEFLLVGDAENPLETFGAFDVMPPVRFVPTHDDSADAFFQAVRQSSQGAFFHFPPLDALLPLRWITGPLNSLIDNAWQSSAAMQGPVSPNHPVLAQLGEQSVWNCNTLYRLDRLRRVDGGWTIDPLAPEAYGDAGERVEVVSGDPHLSVVVATCNRQDILLKNLRALTRQTLDHGRFEVLVCDDGSDDDTRDVVAGFDAPFAVRYERSSSRRGPAAARNMGIRNASGDVVVFLNDDAILYPEGLAIHHQAQAQLRARPCSVLGGFELPASADSTPWGMLLRNSDLIFDYPGMHQDHVYDYKRYYTCNVSTPRKLLVEAGLFDEAFTGTLWGAEDIDLGYRLDRLGLPVLYRSDCRAVHLHDLDLADFRRMFRVRGGGAVRIFAKYPELNIHYAKINQEQIEFWRALPQSVAEPLAELEAEIEAYEQAAWSTAPERVSLPSRQMFAAEDERGRRLWALGEERLREIVTGLHTDIAWERRQLLAAGGSIGRAAAALYPAGLYLRWHYDMEGVAMNDSWLERIVSQERRWSDESLARVLASRSTS